MRSANGRFCRASTRSATHPDGSRFVDVCPLCSDIALNHGWGQQRGCSRPRCQEVPRGRRQKSLWRALLGAREEVADPVISGPDPAPPQRRRSRSSKQPQLDATQSGARSRGSGRHGEAKASIIPLSGVNAEVVPLSWGSLVVAQPGLQNRHSPCASPAWTGPVRAQPGLPRWNATVTGAVGVAPQHQRL